MVRRHKPILQMTMDVNLIETRKARAGAWFEKLRDRIVTLRIAPGAPMKVSSLFGLIELEIEYVPAVK